MCMYMYMHVCEWVRARACVCVYLPTYYTYTIYITCYMHILYAPLNARSSRRQLSNEGRWVWVVTRDEISRK